MKKEILTEDQKRVLLSLYPEYNSVNGPYLRKDGRYHVILRLTGTPSKTNRKTISYPKVLMEIHLGKKLETNETVDHKYGDHTDNRIENLEVLTRAANAAKAAKRVIVQEVICVWCSAKFIPSAAQRSVRGQTVSGPFCSRICTGKYGASVQNTKQVIPRETVVVQYYSLNNGGVVELV